MEESVAQLEVKVKLQFTTSNFMDKPLLYMDLLVM